MKITWGVLVLLLGIGSAYAQNPPSVTVDPAALTKAARASKLIGAKVYRGDAAIGEIEDVLVDLQQGTAPALVLSVGGFLGMGEKRIAVAPSEIKIGSEARFVTDLTKEQLEKAPAFDMSKLQ